MDRKFLFGLTLLLSFALMGNTTSFADTDSDNGDTNNGKTVSEQHKTNVTKVVEELERIADKDRGIENEVKSVAQEEKDAVDEVSKKIAGVEKRGGFKTFLIGSDYKNLGALRSELVKTDNHIDRLTRSIERAASSFIKVELENQVIELESIRTKAETFIKEQEGKFSLFGWMVKMFSK